MASQPASKPSSGGYLPYMFQFGKQLVQAQIDDGWLFLISKTKSGELHLYRVDLGKVCTIGIRVIPGKLQYWYVIAAFFLSAAYYNVDPLSNMFGLDLRIPGAVIIAALGVAAMLMMVPPGNTVLRLTTESGEIIDLDGVDREMEELEGYLWKAIQTERGFL